MAAANHHATTDLAQKNQMTKSPNLNQNIIMAGEVISSCNCNQLSRIFSGTWGFAGLPCDLHKGKFVREIQI